jgi:hypothetical protein
LLLFPLQHRFHKHLTILCYMYTACSSPQHPNWLWGPSSLLFNWYQGLFPGVKQPRCEADHSPQSSAEVKNEWRYTYTLCLCLHGVYKDNSVYHHLLLLVAIMLGVWAVSWVGRVNTINEPSGSNN